MLNNNLNLEMLINIMDDDLFDNLLKNSKNGYYNDIPLVIFIQTEKQAEYYIQNYGKIIEIDLIIDNKEILKNLNVKNFQILIEFFLEDFLEKEILIKELLENLQNKECPEVKKLAYQYINKYNLDEANIFMNWRKSKLINEIDKETKNFKDNGIDYIWLIGIVKKDKNGLTLFECYISKDINREPVNTQKIQKILEDNIEGLLSFSEYSNKTLLNVLTKNYPLMTLSLIKKNLINAREDKVRKEIEKVLASKMNINNSLIEEELLKQHLIKIDKEILSEGIKNIDNNFKKNRL